MRLFLKFHTMYKKSLTLLVSLFIQITFLFASAPAGYYTSSTLDGKNTSALRTALQTIITNGHSILSYDTELYPAYSSTDINPSTGKIWDMYSNCSFTYPDDENHSSYSSECDNYNREHTTPQSWFGGSIPMYSDLFNVYPTDSYVNNRRSNYPYGEVGSATYTSGNGSKLGTSNFSGYSGIVFEPVDEYKGDFARTYFYMATRYADICSGWASNTAEAAVVYGNNLGFTQYAIDLFLKWSRQDPVSQKEIDRNDAVYGKQNNRNPFIDFPGLEEYIWGNKTTEAFYVSGGTTVTAPTVTSPTSTDITPSSATLGGNITSVGNGTITESGIYYSATDGFADGTGTKVTGSATTTGAFTVSVNGLSASTPYYYKAFATNSAGTGYTSQASFITSANNGPTIVSGDVRNSGATLTYGTASGSATKSLYIKTERITGDLTVTVSGTGFSTSVTTIPMANAQAGYYLFVYFNPTTAGTYTGTLTISGGGLVSDYQVNLSGSK
ncbi:Extracellular ribonuclease (fragment) [uncultured Paludibacter sp.]|uniref:Extracellular ribonuclease n=1 Tax=uncultured Paludibacter sp. TaxID=497635 RepID=A0A653AIQ8_9BACT